MRIARKMKLLRALDAIIADVREATAAIQRDEYDEAIAKFEAARDGVAAAAKELRAA